MAKNTLKFWEIPEVHNQAKHHISKDKVNAICDTKELLLFPGHEEPFNTIVIYAAQKTSTDKWYWCADCYKSIIHI